MIRRAAPSDAAAIAVLWNPYIRDTAITFNATEKTADDVARMIAERDAAGQATFVAVDGDALLGFASYAQFRGGIGYARTMEHTVILSPAATGKGIGRQLMQVVEDHARAGGVISLFAGVSAENPAGRDFHARIGFAEVAVLREVGFKFGRRMDLVLMQKFL